MTTLILTAALIAVTVIAAAAITLLLVRKTNKAAPEVIQIKAVAERVRSVGKLVGLEVHAKEIATAKAGWGWVPPILLSQARIAMIFEFEKQYFADLSIIGPGDVHELEDGSYRVAMPPVEGALRLIDVEPYDIQQGRVLGLVEVISMTAERQSGLMAEAQRQAGKLFEEKDAKFRVQAQHAVERQLVGLLEMLGVRAELVWPASVPAEPPMEIEAGALR